jgi:hypothetical protein
MFNVGNPYPRQKQTVFVTDFRDGTVGAAPVGWSKRWLTTHYTGLVQTVAGSISGKALALATTTINQLGFFSWDRVPLAADVEILCRGRVLTNPLATIMLFNRPGGRASGGIGTESAYSALAFYHTSSATDWRIQTNKNVAGAASIIAGPADGPAPLISSVGPSVWIWTRFRINAGNLSRKSWQDGAAEPAFQAVTADASLTAGGWVGEYMAESVTNTREIDFYSVAINGKTAPGP